VRWIVITGFVLAWYAVNGYRVGTADHGLLTPMVDRLLDSNFLAGDYLYSTNHPTLLWYVYAPFFWALGTEWASFLMHVSCLIGLGYAVTYLARSLTNVGSSVAVSAIALTILVPIAQTFGALPTFDDLILPRVVSLAPLLVALGLAAKGRYAAGFALAGLVFNLHPTTAAHAAVLIGGLWLLSKPTTRRRFLEPLAFIGAALPLLLMLGFSGHGSQVSMPFPQAWLDLTAVSWPFHHFPQHFSLLQWIFGVVPWLFWLGSRSAIRSRAADAFMIATLVFCGIGFILINYLRVPQALAIHVFESTRFAHYIAAILVAAWVVKAFSQPTFLRAAPGLLAGLLTVLFSITGYDEWELGFAHALPLGVVLAGVGEFFASRTAPPSDAPGPLSRYSNAPLIAAAVAAVLTVSWLRLQERHRPMRFTIDASVVTEYGGPLADTSSTEMRDASGLNVMKWCRDNLSNEVLVAIPPVMFHPLASFRVVAKRRPFVTWKDGSEAAFSEAFAEEWKARITSITSSDVLAPLPPGNAFMPFLGKLDTAGREFQELDEARLRTLRDRYGVTHVLRNSDSAALHFPLLYEDSKYRLYTLAEQIQE
tara:strand:+ start:79160 stop:80938 length:1779 start_codon:yes stop_codon:yes gene_type:complete